jgi:hypothetical protein
MELYKPLMFYGENIVASEGEQWKRYRKISAPAFSEVVWPLISRESCSLELQRNNKLVWDETIKVTLDMLNNVWGTQDQIVVDHTAEITLTVGIQAYWHIR